MMSNGSGEIVHPCLVLDLREKAFSLSPLVMMLAISYLVDAFLSDSISSLLRVFIMNACLILSYASSASIEMITCFSFLDCR